MLLVSQETETSSLKGHGNEADLLGFLQKSVLRGSLTLPCEPYRQDWYCIFTREFKKVSVRFPVSNVSKLRA
jgi:hypothetical protein